MADFSFEFSSDDEAWDDGYWDSLLQQGEHVAPSAPPPDDLDFIDTLGASMAVSERRSAELAARATDWQRAEALYASGDLVRLAVTGYNRGGLLVQFGSLHGFVPASHLTILPRIIDANQRLAALSSKIGAELDLRVIELDRERNRLILSQRVVPGSEHSADLLCSLQPGQVCSGKISNLRPFGAFVDLGGVEGLIHISELSWGRVDHPGDIVQPGKELDVFVMSVDREQRKIALSLKRLHPDPWSLVESRYRLGQLAEGVVTNVVSFGAFVRLEEGLEGLIHISELAEGNFLHPRNVVQEGDHVLVRVVRIDSTHHRLGLSLRQARVPRPDTAANHERPTYPTNSERNGYYTGYNAGSRMGPPSPGQEGDLPDRSGNWH